MGVLSGMRTTEGVGVGEVTGSTIATGTGAGDVELPIPSYTEGGRGGDIQEMFGVVPPLCLVALLFPKLLPLSLNTAPKGVPPTLASPNKAFPPTVSRFAALILSKTLRPVAWQNWVARPRAVQFSKAFGDCSAGAVQPGKGEKLGREGLVAG